MKRLLCGKGVLPPIKEIIWELDVDLYNTMNVLNIHLIMADFTVCKFYLSEPFFPKQKKGEGLLFSPRS